MRPINNMSTSQVAKRKTIKIDIITVRTICKVVCSNLEALVVAYGGRIE